jgi:uncharacterized protein (DUF2141 family)
MFSNSSRIYIGFIVSIFFVLGCANRGRPSGGEKDVTPPEILKAVPENYSTNFKGDEIKIYFNEFVKLKDLSKQLIVSPPMDTEPDIRPLGSASKYITIKIKDTLDANTTYALNFGQSIVDNNEENPFSYYRYVFSTGDTIDSLSVNGIVLDAQKNRPDTFVSVMLYEADTTYADSIVYKQKPKYVTNTLDSLTTFSIDNIKAGKYKLVALKDENSNFTYQPKQDKIGFYEGVINVPTDSIYEIKLFKEDLDFKILRPAQIAEQRIVFPFEGNPEGTEIEIQNDTLKSFEYRITRDKEKDSLYYWYKPKLELDSTYFVIKNKTYTDTLKHKFRKVDVKDSLTVSILKTGALNFYEDFTLVGSTPFSKIDTTRINFIDKDSIKLPYKVEYDKLYNRYKFPIELKEDGKYKMQLLPNALTDFYGKTHDTLNFNFSTRKKSDFGNIRVNLINAKFPLIVQLVDDTGEVLYEQYAEEYPIVDFSDINPKKYYIRAIFDVNKNKVFDTGNYLKKRQAERVSYYPDAIDVRPNFDYIETFTLKD